MAKLFGGLIEEQFIRLNFRSMHYRETSANGVSQPAVPVERMPECSEVVHIYGCGFTEHKGAPAYLGVSLGLRAHKVSVMIADVNDSCNFYASESAGFDIVSGMLWVPPISMSSGYGIQRVSSVNLKIMFSCASFEERVLLLKELDKERSGNGGTTSEAAYEVL